MNNYREMHEHDFNILMSVENGELNIAKTAVMYYNFITNHVNVFSVDSIYYSSVL